MPYDNLHNPSCDICDNTEPKTYCDDCEGCELCCDCEDDGECADTCNRFN